MTTDPSARVAPDIASRLRTSTEAMANGASVPMWLWDEHSNACLDAAAEIERLRQRERMCDSQCGAIQAMSEAWYRAEKEFDLPDDDPYQAIERLRAALQVVVATLPHLTGNERSRDSLLRRCASALAPASETKGE